MDVHWKVRHETVMPYKEAWPLIQAGTHRLRAMAKKTLEEAADTSSYQLDKFKAAARELGTIKDPKQFKEIVQKLRKAKLDRREVGPGRKGVSPMCGLLPFAIGLDPSAAEAVVHRSRSDSCMVTIGSFCPIESIGMTLLASACLAAVFAALSLVWRYLTRSQSDR